MGNLKKILILGAGYAGVHAAKLLHKKFKKNENVEVTLIDKNPFHTLMTDLHEVAGGRVEEDAIRVDIRKIFAEKKVDIVTDEIIEIDFDKQQLISDNNTYEYDYLIIGTGAEPTFFSVPGAKENGFTIWSLEDALKIKNHIQEMFKKANIEGDEEKRKEMLTFVVAGAGFTGVEVIGELAEWRKKLCRDYDINEKEVRLIIVEAMPNILPILDEKLQTKAKKHMEKLGIEVITNSPITEVNKDSIVLKDGTKIQTRTLIWTAGVQGGKFSANLGLTLGKRGRVQTNEYMQSVDYENVYVVGDSSYYEENEKPVPQIVEAALQTAETAVNNIVADMEEKPKEPFKSNFHGFMVSIGSRYAVANVVGVSLSGFLAMILKHLVNIHYLFGVGGFALIWKYMIHEFFNIKENRSVLGGHASKKSPAFWQVPLRIFLGANWLYEGIKKVQDGWLNPDNIFIVPVADVSAASGAAETVTSASQAVETVANMPTPLLSQPPALYSWFTDTFIAPNAFLFQATVVLLEIGIGLALIAGLFTVIASLGSIFLCTNFILSAMAGTEILWYVFASIAILGGAGRTIGLDYYVIPWIKNWWKKRKFAKKTYLFIE